jgi:phosphoglycolate phosphatase
MKRLIIFDWDDTFVTGGIEGYYQCYHAALQEAGVALTREEEERVIHSLWGRPHKEVITQLTSSKPETFDQVVASYNEHLLGGTFLQCLSLIPGSLELLEDLKDDYILTIASAGNPTVLKEKVFPYFGIPPVFAQVLTSRELEDPSRGKPFPDLALKILEEQHVAAEEAVVVGDGEADVHMAQAAGIEPIVVLTGQLDWAKADDLGVSYIIEDLTKLRSLLRKLG